MVTLNSFIQNLLGRCQTQRRRLALPEGNDPRVQAAALKLLELDAVAEVWLYGSKELMMKSLPEDPRLRLWDEKDPDLLLATKNHFAERAIARGKPSSDGELMEISTSVLNQAAMHLCRSEVDAAVAGCAHTTADVIRASLKGVGLKDGIRTLSGAFAMIRGAEVFFYGDCGVVADPTAEQLADIAEATAHTATLLAPEITPRIAFLSFSTKGSAEHKRVEKVREGFRLFEAKNSGILADGELQFDAALDPVIAKRKAPGSLVAGSANCFIFPDLDAGNIAYKITQRLGGFEAYGPILQGGAKPYLDLSRGASGDDIVVSGLIAIVKSLAQTPSVSGH